jgi:DNA modification methylase
MKPEEYDYEIIVGLITVIDPTYYDEKNNKKTSILPATYDSTPRRDGWMELTTALKDAGIENASCHFDKICCEEARYYFGKNDVRDKIENLRRCVEDYQKGDHMFYCPFCGKKLHFVWKNLGTFRLGRVKKEVCSMKFDKVE